jgi:hypothetical protein
MTADRILGVCPAIVESAILADVEPGFQPGGKSPADKGGRIADSLGKCSPAPTTGSVQGRDGARH